MSTDERNRLDEFQLWDRSGTLFTRAKRRLPRRSAKDLLQRPTVQVAVSRGWPPRPTWIDTMEERVAAWEADFSRNLEGSPGWKPPRGARGQLPLQAELWESADGAQVLLFNDHD